MKFIRIRHLISLLLVYSFSFTQTSLHTYRLIVIDQDKKPLVGATIEYEFLDGLVTVKKDRYLTDSKGQFLLTMPATIITTNKNQKIALSELRYTIDLSGYFTQKGSEMCIYGSYNQSAVDSVVSATVALEPLHVYHEYILSITSFNDKPVKAATVKLSISSGRISSDTTITTDENGQASISVQFELDDTSSHNYWDYHQLIKYEISRQGYYGTAGELSSDYGSKESFDKNPRFERIRIRQPIDYLQPNFANSKQGATLKKNILAFIDLIRIQSILSDASLEYGSFELVTFKANKYLRIKLSSAITYNSLKLNNYDIGKRLFDDVARKVLNPLNTFISDPKLFFGYDLLIVGHTKDFSLDDAAPRPLEFRFLMPESAVKSYKNKDISGQQLLNRSVILLDDERIDLTLQ